MITQEQLADMLDEAFAYMAKRAQANQERAEEQLAHWLTTPTYQRSDADSVQRALDKCTRWTREAAWLTHKPEVLLPVELVLIPACAADDTETDRELTLLRLAEAGTHIPVVALVVAEA